MASGNIYVQITASQGVAGKSRSVVVLVPESARKAFEEAGRSKPAEADAIARKLAEPFAKYAFTHRTIFDDYEVSYAFYENEPHEISGRPPHLTQNGLKAWIV
jgi:hypothetical protein